MSRRKQVFARETKGFEHEIPSYLKTSWTSNENDKVAEILDSLREAFPRDTEEKDENDPKQLVMGLKGVFSILKKDAMSIMCVIACIDNGQDSGVISRLARDCYSNGVPLVLVRGPRQLGSVFGKQRVSCVALTRFAASRPGLLDFIMNMSAISSSVSIPLEETSEIKERFLSVCESMTGNVPRKRAAPKQQPITKPPVISPQNPKKKQKVNPQKNAKGSFFISFD